MAPQLGQKRLGLLGRSGPITQNTSNPKGKPLTATGPQQTDRRARTLKLQLKRPVQGTSICLITQ